MTAETVAVSSPFQLGKSKSITRTGYGALPDQGLAQGYLYVCCTTLIDIVLKECLLVPKYKPLISW